MHVHLPKPLHGWREFAGEVGIIVLGVLIALALEQVVEAQQWRDKVNRAVDSMRIELADDDGPQAYARELIGECLDKRITSIRDGADTAPADQLRKWAVLTTLHFAPRTAKPGRSSWHLMSGATWVRIGSLPGRLPIDSFPS